MQYLGMDHMLNLDQWTMQWLVSTKPNLREKYLCHTCNLHNHGQTMDQYAPNFWTGSWCTSLVLIPGYLMLTLTVMIESCRYITLQTTAPSPFGYEHSPLPCSLSIIHFLLPFSSAMTCSILLHRRIPLIWEKREIFPPWLFLFLSVWNDSLFAHIHFISSCMSKAHDSHIININLYKSHSTKMISPAV